MKTYLLAGLIVLLACCYVGSTFADHHEAGETEMPHVP